MGKRPVRIGFLFNHFFVHQVPHAAPYAFELSRRRPDFEVIIVCSSKQELKWAERIGTLYPGHRCVFKRIGPAWYNRPRALVMAPFTFKRKKMVLESNVDFFRSLDALVAPERHCIMLRSKLGIENIRLIHARHGAGDREGGFDEKSGAFDLTLLPGQKYVDRLKEVTDLRPGSYAVVGWPKFEVVRGLNPDKLKFFDNDNPVVVYNPHFDERVSSWEPMGLDVLDFFVDNPNYNLIFAPHVVLFKRFVRHGGFLPKKYRNVPNILIDTGSQASSDMTYILNSDIYLGDVSSQVYEFLLEPRPCIHLSGHGAKWQGDPNYFHFTFGQVVEDVEKELGPALERAFETHKDFLDVQRHAFEYTFRTEADSTAAERGADAIAKFLSEPAADSDSVQ
jgi:hypothetical protein